MSYTRKLATINLNAISSRVKQHLLKEFVWNNDLDVIFMQEVAFENFAFLPTHKALINISDDGKGTGILVRSNIEFSNLVMNCNGRIISLVIDGVNFVNVYGHSGTKYKKERDLLFTDELLIHLGEFRENVILGDFNCIIDKNDSSGPVKNMCKGLRKMVTEMDLRDVELAKNDRGSFTFIRGGSRSRIDRIYGSTSFVETVKKIATMAVPFSDHHSVVLTVELNDVNRLNFYGRGYWKMNLNLLDNAETQEKFKTYYAQLKNRNSYNSINFWWNNDVKNGIKKFFKNESFVLNQQLTREKSFYYKCFNDAVNYQTLNIDVSDELKFAKTKLMNLEQNRLNRMRSKVKAYSLQSDEKLSFYQVTSFINRSAQSRLLKLKVNDEITSNPSILKKEIFDHFSKKFEKKTGPNNECGETLACIDQQLTEDDKQKLVEPIRIEEIEIALREASKNSAPGPDGINYEFYSIFFDLLKNDIQLLFNSYLVDGEHPPGLFTPGIITLIPKKGNSFDLDNKRPISMLNSDYKLFTKVLCNRLKPIMPRILGPGQSACVEKSSCVDNLTLLRNIIVKANKCKKFKGIILSVDLEKAFDRVDHEFLWKILEKFGFPDMFINCLKKLYKNATSKVLFNGFLTNSFPISSSVRQGCPLSMFLFALYIEPLLQSINKNIKGVLVDDVFIRVIAYADDLNIFIRNDAEFSVALELINYYSIYSRIKINFSKSQFLRLNNCSLGPQLIKESHELKILGVFFHENYKKMIDLNYNELIKNINYSIALQFSRRLNIVQKIWVLNTYVLSKLWYVAQLFPPDNKHIALIRKKCGNFIWKGSFYKVERKELYAPEHKGGLSLIDIESKAKALFIKNILCSRRTETVDEFMIEQSTNKNLSRNTCEWIKLAIKLKNENIETSKQIYDRLIDKMNITIKQQEKKPNFEWENIFENSNQNFLSSESRSSLFMVLRDLVPCKSKLFRHKVRGIDSPTCDSCGRIDDVDHRIKSCIGSSVVWNWLNAIIKNQFRINIDDAQDMLSFRISDRNCKFKAALWLIVETMKYCITKYNDGNVEELKTKICVMRWNNKHLFKKHFKKYMYLL